MSCSETSLESNTAKKLHNEACEIPTSSHLPVLRAYLHKEHQNQEYDKIEMVIFGHTISNPWTMMIKCVHTLIFFKTLLAKGAKAKAKWKENHQENDHKMMATPFSHLLQCFFNVLICSLSQIEQCFDRRGLLNKQVQQYLDGSSSSSLALVLENIL